MRLAPAHDSTDPTRVGWSNQAVATLVGRSGQALAENSTEIRTNDGRAHSRRDQSQTVTRLQVLLHVLAVCSGLALLVIAVLPLVSP